MWRRIAVAHIRRRPLKIMAASKEPTVGPFDARPTLGPFPAMFQQISEVPVPTAFV